MFLSYMKNEEISKVNMKSGSPLLFEKIHINNDIPDDLFIIKLFNNKYSNFNYLNKKLIWFIFNFFNSYRIIIK
jgi:hypothetical protein